MAFLELLLSRLRYSECYYFIFKASTEVYYVNVVKLLLNWPVKGRCSLELLEMFGLHESPTIPHSKIRLHTLEKFRMSDLSINLLKIQKTLHSSLWLWSRDWCDLSLCLYHQQLRTYIFSVSVPLLYPSFECMCVFARLAGYVLHLPHTVSLKCIICVYMHVCQNSLYCNNSPALITWLRCVY